MGGRGGVGLYIDQAHVIHEAEERDRLGCKMYEYIEKKVSSEVLSPTETGIPPVKAPPPAMK